MAFIEKKGAGMPKDARVALLGDSSPIQGFIDFLDGTGLKPFQNTELDCDDCEPLAIGPVLTGPQFAAERLEKDATFLSLHPRVRNAVIMSGAASSKPVV